MGDDLEICKFCGEAITDSKYVSLHGKGQVLNYDDQQLSGRKVTTNKKFWSSYHLTCWFERCEPLLDLAGEEYREEQALDE